MRVETVGNELELNMSNIVCFFAEQVESRKRLAKTVLVFVALFAVCWLPSHIIYLYRSYHYSEVGERPLCSSSPQNLLHFMLSQGILY